MIWAKVIGSYLEHLVLAKNNFSYILQLLNSNIMETKDLLTLISVVLTLLTILKGIYEYKKAHTWKKT